MANRLASESSPYLRQHADNPVDWFPWGAEAFDMARRQDKPILLSIGYAACHWCHVMAHESFEDAETAEVMNELFVNVKVDREERPDVDSIYMQAVQAMIGHGGWPMTVFITPDGDPYWAGTYFPRDEHPGSPSFKRVLKTVAAAWTDKRDAVQRTTEAMRDLYRNSSSVGGPTGEISTQLLQRAAAALQRRHDTQLGGFEGAPKFPQTMALDFLLRWHARSGDDAALQVVRHSFRAMARGGIYDQVGGGFHRYSVDAEWLVPHFEKMLYDNALLARLGVHLWQVTGDAEVRRITEETLTWVQREMTDVNGGFYSSLDADSEGEEGKFFVWTASELDALLGNDARVMRAWWNVRPDGNFEGHSILHAPRDADVVAVEQGLSLLQLEEIIARSKNTLYDARSKRVWPGRDDKVLASWNGLMLRALADAARVFGDARWTQMAVRNGEFLRDRLLRDGRVTRVYMEGETKVPGFLEDHAAVALAFLALHALTLDPSWISHARDIGAAMERHFRDPATGAWYDTANDAEALITRPRDLFDNATPAGNSMALELMLWLSELDGDMGRRSGVLEQMAVMAEPMAKWPNGFGHLLGAADLGISGGVALVLVAGDDVGEAGTRLRDAAAGQYLPTLLVVSGAPQGKEPSGDALAILEGRTAIGGKTTAYVCRSFTCQLPTSDPVDLARQLRSIH